MVGTLVASKFRSKYGKDHIYCRIYDKGLKTKLKDGRVLAWHDKKIIRKWMKNYMKTHDNSKTWS